MPGPDAAGVRRARHQDPPGRLPATGQLTRKQFEDLFEVRLLLEPARAARAAVNRTDEQRDAMLACAAVMKQMTAKPVLPTYGELPHRPGLDPPLDAPARAGCEAGASSGPWRGPDHRHHA
jgi:DNA-binding FadR family transcriptional regulator